MKISFKYSILIMICFIAIPLITLAQGPPDPEDIPIDGGLGILLAAGVGYGVKKYRENKKHKNLPGDQQPDK